MARARSIGNVYAELSVKDKMSHGLQSAEKSLGRFVSSAKTAGLAAAAALPAALFAGVAASMKSAIDAGGDLADMMTRTGAEGEGLFIMGQAFKNAGIEGDKVPDVLNRLQKALAGVNEEGERIQTRVFGDLGLNIDELRGMDAVKAFRAISEAIARIPDDSKRAATAIEIFSRAGGDLLGVMNDPAAFANAEKQVGELGRTLADNAAELDRVSDAMDLFQIKAQQAGAELAVAFMPQLEAMAAKLESTDMGHVGTGIADLTGKVLDLAGAYGELADKIPAVKVFKWLPEKFGGGGAIGNDARAMADEWAKNDPGHMKPRADLSAYTEGVMIRGLKDFTETIPDLLKLRPELVAGMTMEQSGIPGIAGIIDALATSVSPIEGEERQRDVADFKDTQFQVNELQSRGLGYGGETVAKEAQQQVEYLKRIHAVLEKASVDGVLTWP